MQRDPIGYVDSINLYQYVFNSPINWTDASGLKVDYSKAGKLMDGINRIKQTSHGACLFKILEESPDTYQIIEKTESAVGSKAEWSGPTNKQIVIDLDFHPLVLVEQGNGFISTWERASTERIIAHEIGHAATGITDQDSGLWMSNVVANENPIMRELGEKVRVQYEIIY